MVALDIVHASNAQLRELGPGLVALFVGGTSGIGEFTLKAFVQNTISPRVYLVGRSASAAERIIKECEGLNKDGKVEFLQADVTELAEVDRVCKEIGTREKTLNLLVQTQGNFTFAGRQENDEGLDRKMTLNYYSRMCFIHNLRPLLRNGAASPPHFSRTLSVLSPGSERRVDLDDLELKNSYSGMKCANHTVLMNDLMTGEFASREPGTTFVHSFPAGVNTGLARGLPIWARVPLKVLTPLLSPFLVSADETGARQLFIATSGIYPPAKPVEGSPFATGTPVPKTLNVMKGGDGQTGSGGYLVNWNGEITGNKILDEYREKGASKTVWEHTMGIFDRVDKANQGKVDAGSS
ncbi:Uncharacterized protein BP5553_06409 [Venustampulla echinocandica]|uniref:NAD(P)-binding protein n=1 Tax=Venustampulla echinocandica TaxID=2656787 RepID=A0A370TJV4_9HELO|nr:Uncharacterized protein BP5553_06409 [Venustampulla echinocandica]RDL35797.1 Uncharacterized protein BP5553_06409 [Venustampulla echinocandica]